MNISIAARKRRQASHIGSAGLALVTSSRPRLQADYLVDPVLKYQCRGKLEAIVQCQSRICFRR
ncbi:MAG: hypothetical protein IPK93_12740 [Solirubrobacterales bacterium]|nr:hypothetical protein [Solirubrobacterales bacterium]